MAGTTLEYNGITFTNCETRTFDETLLMDETNTDAIGREYRLVVRGWLHLQTITIHGVTRPSSEESTADAYQAVSEKLMAKRHTLTYTVAGETLLNITPSAANNVSQTNADIQNGPTPVRLSIVKVVGGKLLELEYEIKASRHGCNSAEVLSNRWSIEDVLDEDFYTTRTYRGTLRVASGNYSSIGAHSFRGLVLPALNTGFLRKRVRVASTPDNLTLSYEVVDEQTSHAPPKPATTWSGKHTVRVTRNAEGAGTHVTCNVRLTGPEGTRIRRKLLALAARVLSDRLKFQAGGSGHLTDYSLTEVLEKNAVEASATVFKPGELTSGAALLGSTRLGANLFEGNEGDYNRFRGLAPKDFGSTSPAGLLAAHLQGPCSVHAFANGSGPQGDAPSAADNGFQAGIVLQSYEGSEAEVESAGGQSLIYDDSHLSGGDGKGFYPKYEIDVEFEIDSGNIQLPFARASASSNQDTSAIIPLYSPQSRRVITVEASRVGSPPDMPAPTEYTHAGIKYKLLSCKVLGTPKKLAADGVSFIHYTRLRIVQAMSRPIKQGESFDLASLPWDKTTMDENALPTTRFKPNIATRGAEGTGTNGGGST